MLALFWTTHNACASSGSRQYMSAIFTHDATQKRLAEASKAAEESRRGQTIKTVIAPFTGFTLAEDYHQKYYLRAERSIAKEFEAFYPNLLDFVNSTAAARANAWIGGHGDAETVKKELPATGLSAASQKQLLERVGR
jgi:peptide-methionine (S)-S-oxide reductase